MKFRKLMMMPPVFFFIVLALVLLSLPCLMVPFWIIRVKGIEHKIELISHNASHQMLSEIGKRAELLLHSLDTSAPKLARVVNSSVHGVNISFTTIEDKVAPMLFQAILTIPHLSHISYAVMDNLFFSYYYKGDQLLASFSNSSQFANTSFTQPVNPDNGQLYGEATSLGGTNGWENDQDMLLIQTANVGLRDNLSLGFPMKMLNEFLSGVELNGGHLHLATKEGKVIIQGVPNTRLVLNGDFGSLEMLSVDGNRTGYAGNFTCRAEGGALGLGSIVKIQETKYKIYCSTLDVFGMQYVYTLTLPFEEEIFRGNINFAIVLLVVIIIAMVISFCAFLFIIIRASRREMYLCAALIKQMEATQQAERKYLNKSLAYASTSHDIRASLAGIMGLIDICIDEVDPVSRFATDLKQMESCTKDLLGLLNSVLDMSKIDAGKMQLEELQFDMAQLLEDVVDLYHPVGMKKGVDVILNPCDGSIFSKYSMVKGDQTKIKQILSNLLSNAVKFTSEGHVIVRGWAKVTSLVNPVFSSRGKSRSFGIASCFCSTKTTDVYDGHSESMNMIEEKSNFLEYVFEVEDTGIGIPKEKRNSVFENYVQVKETAQAKEGTGLGLGIVQSLVRLMGGEITIIDKETGERGTCFRFNIFLAKSETDHTNEITIPKNVEPRGDSSCSSSHREVGARTSAFSPKQDHSRVVLFLHGDARQRISREFMVKVGVKVSIVKEWSQLPTTLKRIKQKLNLSKYSTSSTSDMSITSEHKSVPLSTMDGTDEVPANIYRRTNRKSVPNFILVIIDTSGGPFRELSRAVADFKRDLHNSCCRIVWIDKPGSRNMINSKGLDEDKLPLSDLIISKPFHGSRLYHVIGLLPEFGGTLPGPDRRKNANYEAEKVPVNSRFPDNSKIHLESKLKGKEKSGSVIQANEEILSGKKILVVEDNLVLMKVAVANISKLGAIVETCKNGEEAVQLVSRGLSDRRKHRATTSTFPFDYIFMDCEMPVMDGYEATRRIREEEGFYGVHIPIIALTAHTTGEEADRMKKTGIDFFLAKPLKKELLIEAILHINNYKK